MKSLVEVVKRVHRHIKAKSHNNIIDLICFMVAFRMEFVRVRVDIDLFVDRNAKPLEQSTTFDIEFVLKPTHVRLKLN